MNSLEALERIYNDAISLNEIEEDVEKIEEDYNIIKKVLERNEYFERPKIARYLNYETGRVQCPTCEYKIPIRKNKILNNINYCPRCGQRLVFSEIELEEVEELENG